MNVRLLSKILPGVRFTEDYAPERARLIADDVQYYAQLREPNEELERYCSIANQEPEGQ